MSHKIKGKSEFTTDTDGLIYHDNNLFPGVN
jgi:hypothetical protein